MNDQMLMELVRQADPLSADLGEPPRALLERVLSAPRRRKQQRRLRGWHARLAFGAVAIALSGAIAALAVAGTGWLTGEPAPPDVVTNFQAYTPQLRFQPDPGSAVLVAEDGEVKLYATTSRAGTYCLDLVAPWKPATALDGGTCVPKAIASGQLIAGNLGGDRTTLVVGGRIADPQARSVQFTGPDGSTVTRPVGSSGFFVAALTTSATCANPRGDWSTAFTALDANGRVLARSPVLSLVRSRHWSSAGRGTLSSCLFLGLQ
jgi:hypothetical protein